VPFSAHERLHILAVNGFQAYWLYTVYRQSREQFARTVRDALFSTVEKVQLAEAQRLFRGRAGQETQRVFFRRFNVGETSDQLVVTQKVHARLDTLPSPAVGTAAPSPCTASRGGEARLRFGFLNPEKQGHGLDGCRRRTN
jgi:hypothetical protein